MTVWMPIINHQLCQGCGTCVDNCPTNALTLLDNKAALTAPSLCVYCAVCEDICPSGAIQLPLMIRRKESRSQEQKP